MHKKNQILHIKTFSTDLSLNIMTSRVKELKGRNLLDLCSPAEMGIENRLNRLRSGSVITKDMTLDLDGTEKRYSVVIRRGYSKFTFVMIELEPIYALMENVNLYRQYAFVDNLTGALTRHGYWNELFELLRYSEKLDYNVGVIFADIDNLKSMNTKFGYKGGDLQIAEMSRTIQKALRKNDMLVRLGGDEFLALLPIRSNKKDTLRIISNRILTLVRNNKLLKTTVSLGIQMLTPSTIAEILSSHDVKRAWESYLEMADQKVKEAKETGKNKAVL